MALTRSQVETALNYRLGVILLQTTWTTDAFADPSPRAYYNDGLRDALRFGGYAIADPAAVADADLAAVVAADEPMVLDVAEYRTLASAFGNMDFVTFSGPNQKANLSDLPRRLERRLGDLDAQLLRAYGYGRGTLTGGAIALGSAQDLADPTNVWDGA